MDDPGSLPTDPVGTALHLRAVPAVAEQAGAVRAAVLRWARAVCRSREIVDDIGLAVYEAMANVIDHAYPAGATHRVFDLYADREADILTVVVADHGRWKPREPDSAPSWRGRGLLMIEKLAAEVELCRNASGTLVRMRWPCPQSTA
ncbi:ATP-binding protein [Kutzneria sp. 744]|uniref:ATP-binding protein n=1 Tax=Kutzneria sp. (strain 744) TaxID=345341 RepID=UPI0003EEB74A|nr:ATP-binding protein [Kutzneria sp. 744]EWM18786.1 histidine kinase [Kutzneria sp. 744]